MTRTLWLLALSGLGGCATVPKGDVDLLKPTLEAFHRAARWKDFATLGELLVPAKKDAFLEARKDLNDERDLFISDCELEDAKLSGDLLRAAVVSRIAWYRLPSATAHDSKVTSQWLWLQNAWRLDSQEGGPFAGELGR